MPALELTNARFNPLYQNGKIYKVTFQNMDLVYIGSTCVPLETRLKQHLEDKASQVFKHKDKYLQITLACNARSQDKKSLEDDESRHTAYATIHGKQLLNKRCNPVAQKEK